MLSDSVHSSGRLVVVNDFMPTGNLSIVWAGPICVYKTKSLCMQCAHQAACLFLYLTVSDTILCSTKLTAIIEIKSWTLSED